MAEIAKSVMDAIDEVAIETRKSNKTGKSYECMIIKFANGYEKMIFLDQAEKFMVDSLVSAQQ